MVWKKKTSEPLKPKAVKKATPKAAKAVKEVIENYWRGHGEPQAKGAIDQDFTLSNDNKMEWQLSRKGYTGGDTYIVAMHINSTEENANWAIRIKTNYGSKGEDSSETISTGETASFTVHTNKDIDTETIIYVTGTESSQQGLVAQLHLDYETR